MPARFLTDAETRPMAKKPCQLSDLGAVVITQERLDELSDALPTIEYGAGTLKAIDDAIESFAGEDTPTELLLDGPAGLILVDTSGYSYARYAAKVGLKPAPRKKKPAPETAAQAAKRNLGEIHKRISDIKTALDDQPKANWGNVGDLALTLEQLTDIADRMHGRGEYAS